MESHREKSGRRYATLRSRLGNTEAKSLYIHHTGASCQIWNGAKAISRGNRPYPVLFIPLRGKTTFEMPRLERDEWVWVKKTSYRIGMRAHRLALILEDIKEVDPDFELDCEENVFIFLDYIILLAFTQLEADHECQQTLCCEAAHLKWVEPEQNNEYQQRSTKAKQLAEEMRKQKLAQDRGRMRGHFYGGYANYTNQKGEETQKRSEVDNGSEPDLFQGNLF